MITERYELSIGRIKEIAEEETALEPFNEYFKMVSNFIILLADTFQCVKSGSLYEMELSELEEQNQKLYEDILPSNYDNSFANPAYFVKRAIESGYDKEYGRLLSLLYSEIRGLIPYVFEQNIEIFVIFMELFIEIYDLFTYDTESLPEISSIRKAIYWFESDNCDVIIPERLNQQLNPDHDFAVRIIKTADLSDIKYLYYFGEYVSENEIGLSKLLAGMSDEEVQNLADVYTEGYRIGFVNTGKDLSKKEVAEVRFVLGLERMVRASLANFEKMGLKVATRRAATLSLNRTSAYKVGWYSSSANKQFDYDHKEDSALYYDKDFINRRISVLKNTFEEMKILANRHAGPACIEVFGEIPFDPTIKPENYAYDKKQQKLVVDYMDQSGRLTNEFIIGEERSFTIISFPCPEIGSRFEEIFRETVRVNTLDYRLYQHMQQILIDTLDTADHVHILGKGENHTDLIVKLWPLADPATETIFENCVADVNIPVGEVFTSPVLKGTNGVLHVTEVYLSGLKYTDLEVVFKDGCICDYSCKNFDNEEENKKYIKDNILNHHDFLPMGEFAIGTNTTAYKMGIEYNIQDRLDILIAEKTGPHFAVGDTCYNYEEDLVTYNPDGKKIVARENDFSRKRKDNPSEAYFHCHTDITIPYNEIAGISAIDKDGNEIMIIEDGLFVLEGLSELNKPLIELNKRNN